MSRIVNIDLSPTASQDEAQVYARIQEELGQDFGPFKYVLRKRSLDARGRPKFILRYEVFDSSEVVQDPLSDLAAYRDVSNAPQVHIIGAGPAGLFAALRCLQVGLKPVVIERGKEVRERRRDLARISKDHHVDEDSNYCFGEGGAGTYSDGKLYTRSKKRGDVDQVLKMFVLHGAPPDIMIDAHPHIGTNKLPGIISGMSNCIREHGGVIRFNEKLTDILITEGQVHSIRTTLNEEACEHLILATGHSARDIFKLLDSKKLLVEYKPFSLGVRVEHPQELIDSIQYGRAAKGEHLPPAAYSMVCQAEGRGAFSFCMCPGGVIAPCATAPGEVVTNGWSPSKRNNPYANSGIVAEVKDEDLKEYTQYGPLKGMHFQANIEQKACQVAGGTQTAPAQRLNDFLKKKTSIDLPDSSYHPGLCSVNLFTVLPVGISRTLLAAFKEFGKKKPAYLSEEAVLIAPESRTSSPVRIPRDKGTLIHPQMDGVYPCGEGAGYAGGIISAAVDGMRCVDQARIRIR